MKKFLIGFIVAALCILSIASCAGKNENELIMATDADFPPFEYLDDYNNIVGFDIDIAEAIAEKLGLVLTIKDMSFKDIVDSVEDGRCDIGMAALTVNEERKQQVSFSNTYASGTQSIIIRENSVYNKLEKFYSSFDTLGNPIAVRSDVKVGVQEETTGDTYASKDAVNWGFGDNNVLRYKTGEEAVQALKDGKISAVVIDTGFAKSIVDGDNELKMLESEYAREDYAICVGKNNTDLLGKINTALSELREDGTLDDIYAKYAIS